MKIKKYVLTFVTALITVLNAYSQSASVEVSDQGILNNGTKTFGIALNNSLGALNYVVSFQMDLTLPEGVSINKDGCGLTTRFADEDQELIIGKIGDNKYRLVSTSFALIPISGYSGDFVNLSLKAASEGNGGVATLSNILIVTDNSKRYVLDDVSFNIKIHHFIEFADPIVKSICVDKWDKNKDGELDTQEAASVTISYLGNDILSTAFKGNAYITSFNELQYFTGIGNIPTETFKGCTRLTSVVVPSSVTAIRENAFQDCNKLSSILIPNSVSSIGSYAFKNCIALSSIDVPNSITTIGQNAFEGCSGLRTLVVPNSITTLGNSVFSGCSGLESVVIPNSISKIPDYAFDGCSSITTLSLPNSITSIGIRSFSDCSSLTSFVIPNNVLAVGKMAFRGCTGLMSIEIPASVVEIEERAFQYCSSLTELIIPKSVSVIGSDAFGGCSGLTSIVVDVENTVYDSRDNCNAIIRTADNVLIRGCQNTSIPNSVVELGADAFAICHGLVSIEIPDNVTKIGRFVFNDCTNLTDIRLSGNIATIPEYSFFRCSSLKSIEIPASVTYIETCAFSGCANLVTVVVKNPTPVTISSSGVFDNASNSTLYVPVGSKAAYKAANYWKNFKEILEIAKIGDVNGDGSVSVIDVISTINYILQDPPTVFSREAADVNGDGDISVVDVIGIIDIILNQ